MIVEVRYRDGTMRVFKDVLEILNVPDTINIVIKCGFPHWETKALIRDDIKKMEVFV